MNKNDFVNKLLKEGKITQEEALILYDKNKEDISSLIQPSPNQLHITLDKLIFETPYTNYMNITWIMI